MSQRIRGLRTTSRHHTVIVEYLEEHPEMLTKKFKTAHSRQKYNECWTILTEKLNSLVEGEKSLSQWQKVLSDWVSRVKGKVGEFKKSTTGTGGGPPKCEEPSEIEWRLIKIKGEKSVVGDNYLEAGFGNVPINNDRNVSDNITKDMSLEDELNDKTENVGSTANEHEPPLKKQRTNASTDIISVQMQMHKETLEVLKEISVSLKTLIKNVEKVVLQ